MNPLQFVSCITTFNLVPLSTVESALTSSTAARMAGIIELPMTELTVNKAPIFTTLGLLDKEEGEEEETVEFLVPPRTAIGIHIPKTNKSNALLFTLASISTCQKVAKDQFYLTVSPRNQAPANRWNIKMMLKSQILKIKIQDFQLGSSKDKNLT